eukprot:scaffold87093_cov25-Tisochrysis_lutea.AAC.3
MTRDPLLPSTLSAFGLVANCSKRTAWSSKKVGHLLKDHAVTVEARGDIGVDLELLRYLKAERRQLAHLTQEANEPVRVINLEREVVLINLHQLPLKLQAKLRTLLLHL